MVRKKKNDDLYSKDESFEKLEEVQQLALNRRGKDDEANPDISVFLKAEELKGKLCGLYTEKDKLVAKINLMGNVKLDGKKLNLKVGEKVDEQLKDN